MIGTNNIGFLVLLHHLSGNLSGLGILPVINKTIDFQSGWILKGKVPLVVHYIIVKWNVNKETFYNRKWKE